MAGSSPWVRQGRTVTLGQVSPHPSSFVVRHQQCRRQHGCSRTDHEAQERGSSPGLRPPTCACYPGSLIDPEGYRKGKSSTLHKLQVQAATALTLRGTVVLGSGRATTPALASQPADVQQGQCVAPRVPVCGAPFSSKPIPHSVRCSCGSFFFNFSFEK